MDYTKIANFWSIWLSILVSIGSLIIWAVKIVKAVRKTIEKKDMQSKLSQVWSNLSPSLRSDRWFLILPIIAILCSGFAIYSIYLVYAKPSQQIITLPSKVSEPLPPNIYEPFKEVYKENETRLGMPKGEAITANNVYEAVHQHAYIISIEKLTTFYWLNRDNSTWKTSRASHYSQNSNWGNEVWLRKHFSPPEPLGPPHFGVAEFWYGDKKRYAWIGFEEWHFFFKDVHFQEFDHGIIMGKFSRLPTNNNPTIMFILTYDNKWTSRDISELEASDHERLNAAHSTTPLHH